MQGTTPLQSHKEQAVVFKKSSHTVPTGDQRNSAQQLVLAPSARDGV